MYLGRFVETGDADDVFAPPYHPYTEALLSAIPVADPTVSQENIRLAGSVPSAAAIPPGCPFHTRCPRQLGTLCRTQAPPWRGGKTHSRIHCHIPLEELTRLQAGTISHGSVNGGAP
jgi:peptide/nickel transport system ATP-binding protein